MSEKIGGAKGTELDDEFTEMERVSQGLFIYFFFFIQPKTYYIFLIFSHKHVVH